MRETDPSLTRAIALILRVGSFGSAVLMLLGILLGWLRPAANLQPGAPLIPLRALAGELARGNPLAVMQAGVLLLLLTPLVRIVTAAVAFLRERDYLYTLVSLTVLAIIVTSLILAVVR